MYCLLLTVLLCFIFSYLLYARTSTWNMQEISRTCPHVNEILFVPKTKVLIWITCHISEKWPSFSFQRKMVSDLIVMILMSCSKQKEQISSTINFVKTWISKHNQLSIFSKKKRSSLSIAKCKLSTISLLH